MEPRTPEKKVVTNPIGVQADIIIEQKVEQPGYINI